MRSVEEILKNPRLFLQYRADDGFKATIAMPTWTGSVICSHGAGWNHVSVSPFKKNIMPSYNDMRMIKDIFWNEDEVAIHIFPAKADYVNNVENCLHLWESYHKEQPLPPSCLVGIRQGQTKEELVKEIKEAYELAGEKYE